MTFVIKTNYPSFIKWESGPSEEMFLAVILRDPGRKVAFFPPLSMILLIIFIHFFVAYEQTLIFSTDLFIAGKDTEGWIILDGNISAYGSTYLIFHGEKWSLIFYSNKKMWTNAFSAYKSDLFLPAVSLLYQNLSY